MNANKELKAQFSTAAQKIEDLEKSAAVDRDLIAEHQKALEEAKVLQAKTAELKAESDHRAEEAEKSKTEEILSIQTAAAAEIAEIRKDLSEKIEKLKVKKRKQRKRLKEIEQSLQEKTAESSDLTEKTRSLQMRNTKLDEKIAEMKAEMGVMKDDLESARKEGEGRSERNRRLEGEVSRLEAEVRRLESARQTDEKLRRQLHNAMQELKGNVRVFCRVRPLLTSETAAIRADGGSVDSVLSHYQFVEGTDGKELEVSGPERDGVDGLHTQVRKYNFSFDKVFPPASSQEVVFSEIAQLVQSALDGYRVCIFAYGQTGSGKTFTMEGPPDLVTEASLQGVIPRSVAQIFKGAAELADRGWSFELSASYLEIYNEEIHDLLRTGDSEDFEKLELHERGGLVEVDDLSLWPVTSVREVERLLIEASKHRSVAATRCNDHSSRSHSVFQLRIHGSNRLTSEKTQGALNLIDLAGSERLAQSGSVGDRQKEAQYINRSLSCLQDVIVSLSNKDKHIPFRNSKLTFLLQYDLSGNAKTLMFANVSPAEVHLSESIQSLRFAAKVNSCEIGTARRNAPPGAGGSSK